MNRWIGNPDDVQAALAAEQADLDANGQYMIQGPQAEFLMDRNDDLMVGPETFYLVGGKPRQLLALLLARTASLPVRTQIGE